MGDSRPRVPDLAADGSLVHVPLLRSALFTLLEQKWPSPDHVWQVYHMCMALKRTTVYLEDSDLLGLKEAASREGISEAEIIREGVRLALARHRVWEEPAGLPLLESGDPSFAARADDILRETGFGAPGDASGRRA